MESTSDAMVKTDACRFPRVECHYIEGTTYRNQTGDLLVDLTPCVQITINGLPRPEVCTMDALSRCQLIRVVHKYKCLLTEGDAYGKAEYQRKRKEKRPIQNRYLRLPITYTFSCSPEQMDDTVRLEIWLLYNTAESARVLAGARSRAQAEAGKNVSAERLAAARMRGNDDRDDVKLFTNSPSNNDGYTLGLTEVSECLKLYGLACSKDLEVFLAERRDAANGIPDYFGFTMS